MKKLMFLLFTLFLFSCQGYGPDRTQTAEATPAMEILSDEWTALGIDYMDAFQAGDYEKYATAWAEDGRFYWSNGDSMMGKETIKTFWIERMKAFESFNFSEKIWLPVRVNEGENPQPGNYLLSWYAFNAKYPNGDTLKAHVHDVIHFNDNKKIDVVYHYIDYSPFMAKMKK